MLERTMMVEFQTLSGAASSAALLEHFEHEPLIPNRHIRGDAATTLSGDACVASLTLSNHWPLKLTLLDLATHVATVRTCPIEIARVEDTAARVGIAQKVTLTAGGAKALSAMRSIYTLTR